jgi:hypothetical protein
MSEIEILNMRNTPCVPDLCVRIVRIDRKTKWGNPYKMETESDRLKVIKKYVYYILTNDKLLDSLPELEEKWLACWCSPKPCHGNVLKYLAEHPELIGMYRGKAISRDDVIQRIWQANGWKCEAVGQQMTLF